MQVSRREFGKLALAGAGTLAIGGSTMLTGCNDQTVIGALLSEMSVAWQAFYSAIGKTLPASIVTAFNNAIAAVKSWVPGTAAQDVVQVLQDLAADLGNFTGVGGLTALEAAAASVILGTIVNIIELIDPSAVPTSASVGLVRFAAKANPPVPQKHFRRGEIPAKTLKKQFEAEWLAVTGKAA